MSAKSPVPLPIAVKRRRKNPLGGNEMEASRSREGSAESNEETDRYETDGASINEDIVRREEFRHPASVLSKTRSQQHRFEDENGNESSASTYDGDVSSVTTAPRRGNIPINVMNSMHIHHPSDASSIHSLNPATDFISRNRPIMQTGHSSASTISPPASPHLLSVKMKHSHSDKPPHHHPAPHGFLARMTPEEIQRSVQQSIAGTGPDSAQRTYRINLPPTGRPVRIYADGVYDLYHFGHALALRQAKLSFPNVHLIVGVCSDELVMQHKNNPILNSAERYESVRNCKYTDELIEDAPWVITQEFLDKHQIDYVAHDEEPYQGPTPEDSDIYAFVKNQGKFLPTRRTQGISTSELLQRIVENYRDGVYNSKLEKMGHPELCSRPGSEAGSSRPRSVRTSITKRDEEDEEMRDAE